MEEKYIRKLATLKEAWGIFKSNFWFLLGTFILVIAATLAVELASFLPMSKFIGMESSFGQPIPPPKWFIAYQVAITFILMAIFLFFQMGVIKIIFKLIDGEKVFFKDLVRHYHLFKKFLLACFLFFIGYFGSFFVFIMSFNTIEWVRTGQFPLVNQTPIGIDGLVVLVLAMIIYSFIIIYLVTRLSFFPFIIVDKEIGPIAAFKNSLKITRGFVLQIVLFFIVAFCVIHLPIMAIFSIAMAAIQDIMVIQSSGIPAPFIFIMIVFQLLNLCAFIITLTAYMIVYRSLDEQAVALLNKDNVVQGDEESAGQVV